MKAYIQVTIFTLMLLTVTTSDGLAQGLLQRKAGGDRRNAAAIEQASGDSTNKRQDVEGTVWEYKVIDPKEKDDSKQTKMAGRIRIKQTSIFAIGKVEINDEKEKRVENADQGKAVKGRGASDVRERFQGLLSQRINESTAQTAGGERIGDLSKAGSSEYDYAFDQDDEYPLSGLVKVKPDKEKKNGVWSGTYEEFSGGRKVKRWRFEMRKIEE